MATPDSEKDIRKDEREKIRKRREEREQKRMAESVAKVEAAEKIRADKELSKHKMDLEYRRERQNMRYQRMDQRRAARSQRSFRSGAPTVAGTVLGSMVGGVMLLAITVSCGPLIDYFQNWLLQQPGNPYVTPVLDLFSWIYIFIFLSWIVYIVVIYRAVTASLNYGVYD
jgi:sterol desaturase/sphingolipid hydroxylase (fatty acid hydroxylase superfamily)